MTYIKRDLEDKIISLWYYRDKNSNEIDMVIENDGLLHPLEIKRSVNLGSELLQTFHLLDKSSVPRGKGAVLCMRPWMSAVNAELHADLESFLLGQGSVQTSLYGINILDDGEIEFDSLINPPRNREAGFPRAGRYVADPGAGEKIREVVGQWLIQ